MKGEYNTWYKYPENKPEKLFKDNIIINEDRASIPVVITSHGAGCFNFMARVKYSGSQSEDPQWAFECCEDIEWDILKHYKPIEHWMIPKNEEEADEWCVQ